MVDEGPEQKQLPMYWILLVYFLLLALNVWLLWFLPDASAIEKVSFVLSIVGIYSLALNFSSDTGLSKAFPDWLDDLTSPNLRAFAAGTFRVASVLFLFASLFVRGFPPPASRWIRFFLILLAIPMVPATLVIAFTVAAAYLVVIAPAAYIGYLFAATVLNGVENAPDDVALVSGGRKVDLKQTVQDHRVQLRTLIVGLPATIVGIGTTAYTLFP
jgi:hypothetical protein